MIARPKHHRTISGEWDSFSALIPPGSPAVQYQEMKKAFFAGFTACLGVCIDMGDANVSEAEAVDYLEGLRMEAVAFAERQVREYLDRQG